MINVESLRILDWILLERLLISHEVRIIFKYLNQDFIILKITWHTLLVGKNAKTYRKLGAVWKPLNIIQSRMMHYSSLNNGSYVKMRLEKEQYEIKSIEKSKINYVYLHGCSDLYPCSVLLWHFQIFYNEHVSLQEGKKAGRKEEKRIKESLHDESGGVDEQQNGRKFWLFWE